MGEESGVPMARLMKDCMYIRVIRLPQIPVRFEVSTVVYGQQFPLPYAQKLWDDEYKRQQVVARQWNKSRILVSEMNDGISYYMQQFLNKDESKSANFAVDFPDIGVTSFWNILQRGVSHWFCETYGSPPGITYYRHILFQRELVSVSCKVYRFLGKLLQLAPHLTCGCTNCNHRTTGSPYFLILYLSNNGTDPTPMPGAYMTLTVCEYLYVRELFQILYRIHADQDNDLDMGPHHRFFRQIEGPDDSNMYAWGNFYYYDDFLLDGKQMRDLSLFSDGQTQAMLAAGALEPE